MANLSMYFPHVFENFLIDFHVKQDMVRHIQADDANELLLLADFVFASYRNCPIILVTDPWASSKMRPEMVAYLRHL
jgi:hypothetical protein